MEIINVNKDFIRLMNKKRKINPNKYDGRIEACSDNVIFFAKEMLGMTLYSWQVLFLDKIQKSMTKKDDREFIALTSRQIGKSTALAIFSIWAAVFNKCPGTLSKNTAVGIASASDVQAKKLLYEMKKFLRLGDGFMAREYLDEEDKPKYGKSFFTDLLDDNEPNNTTTITFKAYDKAIHGIMLKDSLSGSTIKSYPPTSAVLGETFSVVIIDEAGKSDKITDQFFYDYMYPTGNSTNAIRVYTSTPWVSSGFFYRMVDPDGSYGNTPADVVVFTVEAIQLENPEYYRTVMKTVNNLNQDGKNDEVQRAYYCRFVKGELSYFNPDRVIDIFSNIQPLDEYKLECDMGVDFGGQTTSRSVITISRLSDEGEIIRLYHKVYAVGEDNNLINDIQEIMTRFNIQRIIPDDCLVEGTEVLMSDYTRKEIQDIKVGESVLSFNFNINKYEHKLVTKTNVKQSDTVYTVYFRNGTSLTASPQHKWFVKDRVNNKISVVTTEQLNPKKHYIPVALNIPEYGLNNVSKEEAYLLGMYIAEGHKRPTKHSFFISQLKKNTSEIIQNVLEKTNFKWQRNKTGFYLSNTYELEYLFNACGTSSYGKRIPNECFKWTKKLQQSLFDGLMDGDGNIQKEHKDKRGFNTSKTESYYTVSPELNNDVRTLMLLLNKPSHYKARVHSGFDSAKTQYEPVFVEGSPMVNGKLFIKTITRAINVPTYDITVEDNESFILPNIGIITHNCPQGDYLIREMIDKGWNVHPMNFRSDKVKKYGAFRSTLNRKQVLSYNDEDLKTEMLALEFNQGSKQSVIQHAPGYSDDLIDSFIMSAYFFVTDDSGIKVYDWEAINID